jgi:hypothetical protein
MSGEAARGDLPASIAREGRGPALPLRWCALEDGGVSRLPLLPLLALCPWCAGVAGVDDAAAIAANPPAGAPVPGAPPTTLPSAMRTRLCPAFLAAPARECMLESQPAHSRPRSSAPHSTHRIVAVSSSHSSHDGSPMVLAEIDQGERKSSGGMGAATGCGNEAEEG